MESGGENVEDSRSMDDTASDTSLSTTVSSLGPGPRHSAGRNAKRRTGPTGSFRQTNMIKESHGNSIFGVAFNGCNRADDADPLLFATVGGPYVTMYQCLPAGEVALLQAHCDPCSDEDFYCCAWSHDSRTHQQLVAAAGKRGVIRLVCPSIGACFRTLIGHGQSVNELRFHPGKPSLLFSFGKDYNIRMWNIVTETLVCVFGGVEGHRSEVLHGDINLTGSLMISSGMDHSIKIWKLDSPAVKQAIALSEQYDRSCAKRSFPTLLQHFPEFSTRDVHGNYVDCVRWFGNVIVSKSCENLVRLWKPGGGEGCELDLRLRDSRVQHLHHLEVRDCDIWFIRFDIDVRHRVIALGSSTGRCYIWDLGGDDIFGVVPQVLQVTRGCGAVRQTCFSTDGRTLLCVCDQGTVVRFDRD